MAGRKRIAHFTPTIGRTIERVGIAALAAIAARGSGESLALAAVAIFAIVAVIEELGRGWVWRGKRTTLRDVAFASVGELRLQRAAARGRHPKRKRRSRPRRRRSNPSAGEADKGGGDVQE